MSEFATPARNRKREQQVGAHKREGDEEESSPCTGPCKTTTSVRSVPLTTNTTRRVGTKNEVAGGLGPAKKPNLSTSQTSGFKNAAQHILFLFAAAWPNG